MLRIISGKYRHLVIDVPNVDTTKPTTDKVREALMSALRNDLIGATVLDLFAGSGALGLEALSRGAEKAYFCDNNYQAIMTIKHNIEKLRIEEETCVCKCSFMNALEKLKDKKEKVDIVFLDPPYAKEDVYKKSVDFILENDLLSEKGVIVKEWNKLIPIDERFSQHKHYNYGTIHILIERR